MRHWVEEKILANSFTAASDRRAHIYQWCSAVPRTGDRAILRMSTIRCVPRVDMWHGCGLWGMKTLELNFVSLFYLYFLEQVQDSVWKDEGQVHPNSRYTSSHQSQESLLECQWCMHPFLFSAAVVGTVVVAVSEKQKRLVISIVQGPDPHTEQEKKKHHTQKTF